MGTKTAWWAGGNLRDNGLQKKGERGVTLEHFEHKGSTNTSEGRGVTSSNPISRAVFVDVRT